MTAPTDRFRRSVGAVTEADLQQLLSDGLFHEFRAFLEHCDQLRLIAEELSKVTPAADPDVVAMIPINVDRLLAKYQRSVLNLPTVFVPSKEEWPVQK